MQTPETDVFLEQAQAVERDNPPANRPRVQRAVVIAITHVRDRRFKRRGGRGSQVKIHVSVQSLHEDIFQRTLRRRKAPNLGIGGAGGLEKRFADLLRIGQLEPIAAADLPQ